MIDILLESLRLVVIGLVLGVLLVSSRRHAYDELAGWRLVMAGFCLLLVGSAFDLTDNFDELSWLVVVGDTPVQAVFEKVVGYLGGFCCLALGFRRWLPTLAEHRRLLAQEVEQLRGLLPICACCKKVRDDQGYWRQIERYLSERTQATFSHGICPDCHAAFQPPSSAELAVEPS